MSDEQRDTFEQLISDLDHWHDVPGGEVDKFADRLRALLATMEPFLMPVYGAVLAPREAFDSDPPPILADLLHGETPPGSDWVLMGPVNEADDVYEDEDEDDPVTGDG